MNKRIQIGIGAISLFFIFVYPFLLLPYGLDYTDNFYYATAFAGQTQGNVMIFFFSLPGQVWLAFAPHTVLSLRVLGTLLWIALHLLPIGIVLRTFGLDRGPILALTALGIVIAMAVPRGVIGMNVVATFWSGLLFAASVLYLKGKRYFLPLLGVLIGILAAVRLPSLLAILPVLFVVNWKGLLDKEPVLQILRKNSILLLTAVGIYFLLYAVWGMQSGWTGPMALLSDYSKNINALPQRTSDTHGLAKLFQGYIRDAAVVLKTMAVLTILFFFWWVGSRYERTIRPFFAILVLLLSYYLYHKVLGAPYSWNFSLFSSSLAILLIVLVFLLAFRKKDILWQQIAFLGFSFGFVSAAGSNTGLLKLLWAYSYILPIAVFYLLRNTEPPHKHFLMAVLGVVAVFSMVEYGLTGYRLQDGHWYELSATPEHPKLRGIYTSPLRRDQIDEINGQIARAYQANPDRKTIYYGRTSWLFRYLDERAAITDFAFKMPFDQAKEADILANYIETAPTQPFVCIVYGYAENASAYDSGLIGKALEERKYSLYARGNNYELFAPSDAR
jgi:hypothetical protein